MKYKTLLCLLAGLVLTAPCVQADVGKAEDEAYRMAIRYSNIGFAMSTNSGDITESGDRIKVHIDVAKGLDYVFLLGCDDAVLRTELYVYDEVGGLILDDRRRGKGSGVRFRSSYDGHVIVYIRVRETVGMGAYSILVGRRGSPKPATEP